MKIVYGLFFLLFIFVSCGGDNLQKKAGRNQLELRSIASNLNNDFLKIRKEIDGIAAFTRGLYENQASILPGVKTEKYALAPNGVFYKPVNDGGSAVFVSGVVPVNEKIKNTVYFTEPLDAVFKKITARYAEIAQIYYNDEYSYNRIYPYFDVLSQYEPKMNIPDFNFYFLADEKHNPSKSSVWVKEPYVDPAGRGWMVSAIAPVYYKDRLVGVPGIDITINTITDKYILNEPDKLLMLVDSVGTIVTARENVINLLSFPPIKDHKYIETIKLDTYRKESYSILLSKDSDVRQVAVKIMKEGKRIFPARINNEDYYVISEFIPELKWFLIEIIS